MTAVRFSSKEMLITPPSPHRNHFWGVGSTLLCPDLSNYPPDPRPSESRRFLLSLGPLVFSLSQQSVPASLCFHKLKVCVISQWNRVQTDKLGKPERMDLGDGPTKRSKNYLRAFLKYTMFFWRLWIFLLRIYRLYSQRGNSPKLFFAHLVVCILLCNWKCIFSYIAS